MLRLGKRVHGLSLCDDAMIPFGCPGILFLSLDVLGIRGDVMHDWLERLLYMQIDNIYLIGVHATWFAYLLPRRLAQLPLC